MKKLFFSLGLLFWVYGCGTTEKPQESYLVRFPEDPEEEPSGYVNEKGDTVVPAGKYHKCLSDTIRNWGIVWTHDMLLLGIDREGNPLFDIFWFDNGPDYVKEGVFRIQDEEGNIGYADTAGTVIIEPKFAFGFPFDGDSAQVALEAVRIPIGEYSYWDSDEWFYIDKKGNRL